MKVCISAALFCLFLVGWAGAEEEKEPIQIAMAQPTVKLDVKLSTHTVVKTVYLTFDDGPSQYTSRVLDTLKKQGVPATFFVCGNKSAEGIALFKRISAEGHALGNHSFSHNPKNYKNPDDFLKDLAKEDDNLSSATGQRPRIMRFPYGSNTTQVSSEKMHAVVAAVLKAGYAYFDWTVDPQDWSSGATKQSILQTIMSQAKASKRNFAIVLMHDNQLHSVEALPEVIEFFKAQGYRFEKLTPEADTFRFAKPL